MEQRRSTPEVENRHVFVCYSHADSLLLEDVLGWLRAESVSVWYDDGIRPGEEWTAEIASAIQFASHVLFLATRNSVQSRHCRNEIHFAVTYEKPVITMYLEELQLPAGLELELALHQAVSAFGDGALRYRERVLATLRRTSTTNPLAGRLLPASASTAASAGTADAAMKSLYDNSVAVLPLRNLSAGADDDYFSDGVTEEILNRLARIVGLKVIARGSSFSFKGQTIDVRQVGARLNARFIVEGSVHRAAARIRIHAHLSDSQEGVQLWSGRFDGVLEDIFELQDQMADAVLDGLRSSGALPQLQQQLPEQRASGAGAVDAHDALLRGIDARRRSAFPEAARLFEQALQRDPYYSDAYAQLAETCLEAFSAYQGQLIAQTEYLPKAIAAAQRGFQLNPSSEQANRVMSMTRAFSSEWEAAQRFCLRALHINSNNPKNALQFAQLLRLTGRAAQAADYVRWADSLDPLHSSTPLLEWLLIDTRQFAEARRVCLEQIAQLSDAPNQHYIQLACAYGGEGDFEQVVYWQSHRNFPLQQIAFSAADVDRLLAAYRSEGRLGYFREYLGWVTRMKQRGGTFVLDTLLTWAFGELGYLEEAFTSLDLVATGSFIPQQHFYDPLRSDRRWHKFLAQRGLDDLAVGVLNERANSYKQELGLVEPWRARRHADGDFS